MRDLVQCQQNKDITNDLDAWLSFFSEDEPEKILRLIKTHPEFIPLYKDIYALCRNVEKIMGLFSEELREMDRNTVQYMIDEMQDTIDAQKIQIKENSAALEQQNILLEQQKNTLKQQENTLKQQENTLKQQESALAEKDALIAELEKKLAGTR